MNTALSCNELMELLDGTIQTVTEAATGIKISRGGNVPQKDICTMYIYFNQGFSSGLTLYAEKAMLERMTRNALLIEDTAPRDVEDYAKEFFNILCGQITAAMSKATGIASRFSVPEFHWEYYIPEAGDMQSQFYLSYTSSDNEGFQFVHYIKSR